MLEAPEAASTRPESQPNPTLDTAEAGGTLSPACSRRLATVSTLNQEAPDIQESPGDPKGPPSPPPSPASCRSARLGRNDKIVLLVLVGILLVFGVGGILVENFVEGPVVKSPLVKALARVVNGEGVAKAKEYKNFPGLHKIVIMHSGIGIASWQEDIPRYWRATKVEETELVAVVSNMKSERIKVGRGRNWRTREHEDIYAFSHSLDVRIVEARTGRTVDSKTIKTSATLRRGSDVEVSSSGFPEVWVWGEDGDPFPAFQNYIEAFVDTREWAGKWQDISRESQNLEDKKGK